MRHDLDRKDEILASGCSILMPAFNASKTLARSIRSVQAQTHDVWELLIIDDASGDTTADIAAEHAKSDPRICVIAMDRRSGAAICRNAGLARASRRYIGFLDADDTWAPTKLERQLEFMQAHDAAFSYTSFYREKNGTVRHVVAPKTVDFDTLLHGNAIGCLTAIYDTNKLGKVPMPEIELRQDFALWLELLKRTPTAYGLQEPLASHYRSQGSLSANHVRSAVGTWRMYRDVIGLSRSKAVRCLLAHYVNRYRALRDPGL